MPDTFALSDLASATSHAGAIAAAAEERKKTTYISLSQCHSFVPVTIKTIWSRGFGLLWRAGPTQGTNV